MRGFCSRRHVLTGVLRSPIYQAYAIQLVIRRVTRHATQRVIRRVTRHVIRRATQPVFLAALTNDSAG